MNIITNLSWARVNLLIEFQNDIKENVCLQNENGETKSLEFKSNTVSVNITNVTSGDMLTEGKWKLFCDGECVTVSNDILQSIENFSRVFRYKGRVYALIIEPKLDDNLEFFIVASYMVRNKKYKKRYSFYEGKGLKGKIKVLSKMIITFSLSVMYKLCRLFKRKNKTVLFYSENDDEPRGNLKAVYEHFLGLNGVNVKGQFKNRYADRSKGYILSSTVAIAGCDILVVDNYCALINHLPISKNQKVVQVWHAGVGFKAVGYARFGKPGSAHPFFSSHRKYTLAIVDSENLIDIYKEVYGVGGEIFKVLGMPRLQGYGTKENIEEITSKLYSDHPEFATKKVILFSPTYRGVSATDAYYDYNQLDLEKIGAFCKENNFLFAVKMHPFIRTPIEIPEHLKGVILDLSELDINELNYISDIMITDYSSCAFDYSFFQRPLIFFRYDKAVYEYTRPMHTLDMFSKQQYEVTDFEGLMSVLEELKDVKIEERFSNVIPHEKDICDKIAKEILK
ncbi:MAG: CDP-glycerol glycerophosphotransferase family protein [Oscillospiraceae bacterium]|nr:CDP-glycerol glycerophosphotransferase family protein [Oscillospiraceae bacterium]